MDLELELVEHAEIIFTTLSSSGRNIFSRLKDRKYMQIETVLIDEACQVSCPLPTSSPHYLFPAIIFYPLLLSPPLLHPPSSGSPGT